jgi:hypothetical protein
MWQIAEGRTLEHARARWIPEHELDGQAHSALYDVKIASRVMAAQIEQTALPRDLQQLHNLMWADRYDTDGKLRWRDGWLCIAFGEHRDKPLQKIPKSYLRWILGKDFSPKVKKAVALALQDTYLTR